MTQVFSLHNPPRHPKNEISSAQKNLEELFEFCIEERKEKEAALVLLEELAHADRIDGAVDLQWDFEKKVGSHDFKKYAGSLRTVDATISDG